MRPNADPSPSDRPVLRIIERLDALPARALTAREWLVARINGRASTSRSPDFLDPGLALAACRNNGRPRRPAADLLRLPWWPGVSRESDAGPIDALWRHSVAMGLAARRLARHEGVPEADRLGRIAAIAPLALWGIAAVAPADLAQLLALPGPAARNAWARTHYGLDLGAIGRRLAARWRVAPELADAAWLLDRPGDGLDTCATNPDWLRLLRQAAACAGATPWGLSGSDRLGPAPSPEFRRWLIARVQALCAVGLVGDLVEELDQNLLRDHLRQRLRSDQHRREARRWRMLLDPEEGTRHRESSLAVSRRARAAWKSLTQECEALGERLDEVAEAHGETVTDLDRQRREGLLDALGEFAAGAGHELNNPLAVILGRAQLLLGRTSDPEAMRSLRAIIAQAQRAHRILRDLIYCARPPEPRPRACQPGEVVRACVRDLLPEAESRGVRLTLESPGPDELVQLDPDPLRHAIDALVRNALEASPQGGKVQVVGRREPGRTTWIVRDDGPGLRADEARNLFNPFYCGRQAGRGLGLGLPRVARSLAQAGGRIAWKSRPEEGTRFLISLPTADLPPVVPATRADEAPAPPAATNQREGGGGAFRTP